MSPRHSATGAPERAARAPGTARGFAGSPDEAPARTAPERSSPAARAVLVALHAYQGARSGSVSPCRFFPSCSAYAVEAVERHGARSGMWLAARRLARCRPLGGHGVDLVPLEPRRRRRRAQ